jgi:hypothetical protein
VVEELRPGYMFDGRVLRPSMVSVANPLEKTAPDGEIKESVTKSSEKHDDTAKEISKKISHQ